MLNQADAVVYCKSIGAKLTTIETMDEFNNIKMKLSAAGNQQQAQNNFPVNISWTV